MLDFEADGAWPGVEQQRDPVAKLIRHMLGARRGKLAGEIGGRRGKRAAEGRDHFVRHATRRAERDRRKPGRHQRMHRRLWRKRQDQRQRSRPESLRQQFRAGVECPVAPRHRDFGYVANQRVEARAALGLENARHRFAIRSVGGEPVDRLRRQRDQFSRAQRR